MNLQENNHPIDDLFRQTFSSLPPEPNASGWDTPSERVWQQVQAGIKPIPKSGIGSTSIWAGAIVIITGSALVWAILSRPSTPDSPVITPIETAPISIPVTPAPLPTLAPESAANDTPTQTESKKTPPKPGVKSEKRPTTTSNPAQQNTVPQNTEADNKLIKPGSSLPLPGSNTEPHNTTEKKKKEGG